MKNNCGNCRFWREHVIDQDPDLPRPGECRLYPQPVAPRYDLDWCGQHQPKQETIGYYYGQPLMMDEQPSTPPAPEETRYKAPGGATFISTQPHHNYVVDRTADRIPLKGDRPSVFYASCASFGYREASVFSTEADAREWLSMYADDAYETTIVECNDMTRTRK